MSNLSDSLRHNSRLGVLYIDSVSMAGSGKTTVVLRELMDHQSLGMTAVAGLVGGVGRTFVSINHVLHPGTWEFTCLHA